MSSSLSTQPLQRPSPDDIDLTTLYPEWIQKLDSLHWSPSNVVSEATRFLCGNGERKVLDIGSGSGKFCMAASYGRPGTVFYGVEQRKCLVEQAEAVKAILGIRNVEFIHGNFTQLNLTDFNSFYFYNSFFENLTENERIDNSIDYSVELYDYYSRYLNRQLEGMPAGTRIATYCSWNDEIPDGYLLEESHLNGLLKCWTKA